MRLDPDRDSTVELGLDDPDDHATLVTKLATQLEVPVAALPALEVRKRSIDARRGRIRFHFVMGPHRRTARSVARRCVRSAARR
ncbi:MAG: hypothetical protein AB7P03_28475 [Kofleriaceae bacterium]